MTHQLPSLPLLPQVASGWPVSVSQSVTRPFHKLTPILPLTLISALLLFALINAPLASAQDAPPAGKTAEPQVSPAGRTTQHQHNRTSRHVAKEAEPMPAAVPSPVATTAAQLPAVIAAQSPGASPQSVDDRLPFMTNGDRDSHEQAPSAIGLLLRTLGALFLIVGLIVAAAWGLKRFGGARFGAAQENAPPLVVLNSLSLGDRRSLTIVRFGDRTLLLGSTAHAVTLLAEGDPDDIPPPRSVAEILNEGQPMAFSQALSNATDRLAAQPEPGRGNQITA